MLDDESNLLHVQLVVARQTEQPVRIFFCNWQIILPSTKLNSLWRGMKRDIVEYWTNVLFFQIVDQIRSSIKIFQ